MKIIQALSFLLIVSLLCLSAARPAHAQSTLTIGDANLENAADGGNGNLVLAQEAALPGTATLESLSFYVTQAAGNLILGVYDASGPRGGPGKLLASTASFATVYGWNTANVVSPVALPAGNYWLAYLPSSGSLSFLKQNNSGKCYYKGQRFSAGLPGTFSTSPANCTPTTWSFYATLATSTSDVAVNGSCGSSNGADLTSIPTTNLCSTGAASKVSGTGPWNWSCAGSGGGTTASCSAQLQVSGSCGSASGVAVSTAPTANLCAAGKSSAVSGTGPWNWSCLGSNGGGTAACSAPLAQAVVNGSCGAANGVAVSAAPTTNLCTAGTASAMAGSGPWQWSCVGSDGGSTAACVAPLAQQSGGGGQAPALIQHVASSANPVGLGIPGNNFNIPLPNPVLQGDALVLAITFPSGSSSTVSDSLGQNWPAAAITEDGGAGNYVSQIYVLCGSAAGQDTIRVNLTQSGLPFEYTVSEFTNVAASGCVDGAAGGSNLAAGGSGTINPTGFTPARNNDANGGHIIWSYDAISANANGNPSAWVAATGFTLLDGDIAWTSKQGFPHASQWSVQPKNAPVTPSITATGDGVDSFNSVSVSLVVAATGGTMPAGIHINKILHESWTSPATGATLNLELPTTGNLRVLAFPAGQGNIAITGITDSDGGVWQGEQTGGDSAQIWFAPNVAPNPHLVVSVHISGWSPTNSARFFDIQGASAAPFVAAAGTDLTDVSNSATVNNQPTITPSGANQLVIVTMGIGDGPGLGLAAGAPAGAVWDLVTYGGENDNDLMENADAVAHVYTKSASLESWNWSITPNANNSCSAEAVVFR